jgi:hypothetical protein
LVALVAVPTTVVTAIGPVVAPAGTVVEICVELLTVKAAARPLKVTEMAPKKFVPVIVTEVPNGPEVGLKEAMVGAQSPGLATMKSVALVAAPLALVTWIGPVVVPALTVAQISVAETIVKGIAGVPLISTLVTSGLLKSVPVITSTQPAGPLVGENDVIVGTAARAFGIPNDIRAAAEIMVAKTRAVRFILILSTPLDAG